MHQRPEAEAEGSLDPIRCAMSSEANRPAERHLGYRSAVATRASVASASSRSALGCRAAREKMRIADRYGRPRQGRSQAATSAGNQRRAAAGPQPESAALPALESGRIGDSSSGHQPPVLQRRSATPSNCTVEVERLLLKADSHGRRQVLPCAAGVGIRRRVVSRARPRIVDAACTAPSRRARRRPADPPNRTT